MRTPGLDTEHTMRNRMTFIHNNATLGVCLLMVALFVLLGSTARVHGGQQEDQPEAESAPSEATSDDDRDGRDRDHDHDRDDHRRGGPPRTSFGQPPFQPLPTPLDDEQIDHILGLMEDMEPGSSDRLQRLREENPDRFEAIIARIGPHTLYMDHLRRNDPRAYELRREEHELGMRAMYLAHKVRRADDEAEEAEHREELHAVLEEQFDVRTQLLEHEMAQLERRLEHIREQIADQKDRRDHVIGRRMEMILSFDRRRGGRDHRGGRDDDDDHDRRDDDRRPR